jgi:hypothetical protein
MVPERERERDRRLMSEKTTMTMATMVVARVTVVATTMATAVVGNDLVVSDGA